MLRLIAVFFILATTIQTPAFAYIDPATGGAIAAAIIAAVAWGRIGTLPFFGLTVAIGVGIASLAPLWKRKLLRTPLFTWGMVIAHLGCAVSLAGMACDSAFTVEKLVAARPVLDLVLADGNGVLRRCVRFGTTTCLVGVRS